MAQVVERRIGSAEVTGPTPVASLYKLRKKTSHFLIGLFFIKQKKFWEKSIVLFMEKDIADYVN